MNKLQFGWLALGALMVSPILAAPIMQEPRGEPANLRAWALFDTGEAEARTADHRLIGFACGDQRLTMTAREEDHFPRCEAIEAVATVCPEDMSTPPEPVTAAECARYMGDGY